MKTQKNMAIRGGPRPALLGGFHRLTLFRLAAASLAVVAGYSQSSSARVISDSTPASIRQARDLGPVDPTATIRLTLWLQSQHEGAAMEQLVEEMYDKSSPNFHRWLSSDAFMTNVAPSPADLAAVRQFASRNNLTISGVGEHNLYLQVQGSVSDVQNAFQVQLHNFEARGRTFRSNTSDPVIEEPAGSAIAAVSGLAQHSMHPYLARPMDPDTGAPMAFRPLTSGTDGAFFSAQCFRAPQTVNFTTSGGLPSATYSGNRYGADITNTALGTLPPCGYQPSEVQTAYGLNSLYASGLSGQGQTIVIVDAIGSPTIAADAELFSQVYGLPDLTPANFQIYYPGGQPATTDTGWASETTLDVEWAHSVAPNANIALVIAPTSNDPDLQAAVLFALAHHLGNVISNSYGEAEADVPTAIQQTWNKLSRLGAGLGVSVNFASGDSGDSEPSGFTPNVILFGPSTPADSPWATAVGGTSLAVDTNNNILFQTGWGTTIQRIANAVSAGGGPIVPPLELGFQFGSGGGVSTVYAKPGYQAGLSGSGRQTPDIAYLADPYTGVEIICDATSCSGAPPGTGPSVGVIGGTSLACPTFSALWAIANQSAGERLGQAARLLYQLPGSAITDVVPVSSRNNVRSKIKTTTATQVLSPSDLSQPLYDTREFFNALYNGTSTRWYVLTFGADTSLNTAYGWDNVTGLGTPNGESFINAVREAVER